MEEYVNLYFFEQAYNKTSKELNYKNYMLYNFELDIAVILLSVSKHRVNINFGNVYFNTAKKIFFYANIW